MKVRLRILAGALIWIAFGMYNYAATLNHFTSRYGYMEQSFIAVLMGVGGPFATPVVVALCDHPTYLLWKPLTKEQRWMLYHAKFPTTPRCYFENNYGSGVGCDAPADDLELLRKLQEDPR